MTTTPIPTGKIRGSLRDVTPKLRNFVGAVKVTTPSGKGGILVDMGRTVASYLTVEGTLHRGKDSLELLEKVELAEFEILRYDEEQFKEAMIICDNRGLLLPEEKAPPGEKARPPGAPSPARETKPREEENVLSAMMKRFATPKVEERKEPAREPSKPELRIAMPVAKQPGGVKEEPVAPEPLPQAPAPVERIQPVAEKKEIPPPAAESDLSAIIKRLRESGKVERGQPAFEAGPEPRIPAAEVPEPEWKMKAAELAVSQGEAHPPAEAGKVPAEPATPAAGGSAPIPEGQSPEGRVRVDLGKMMKRIKRLDITSIRDELQAGAEGEAPPAGMAETSSSPPDQPAAPATVSVRAPPSPADTRNKSDIDDLKAFIQRLEVLEQPPESPPEEKGLLAKLGVKALPAEPPQPPRKREIPAPISRREKAPEAPPETEARPPETREEPGAGSRGLREPEAPRPAEPDRKAKIASLLRRSGLVKPPAEEQPRAEEAPVEQLISEITVGPEVQELKKEAAAVAAPPGEVEIRVPRPQRKKVEITRVPKKPEKPLKEPPLLDERMIQKILKQPGVIAVSTFFEGFAVQSAGRADFEQVAANAEDLFRAGKKIAREIDIGPLNQIILETGRGKLVIAPHGDLNVCVFTEPDANLGLIRVAIRSMQVDTE